MSTADERLIEALRVLDEYADVIDFHRRHNDDEHTSRTTRALLELDAVLRPDQEGPT